MPRRITVTGMARVEAVPDLATVTVGVTTRAATAAAALAANSEAMAAVIAGLDGAGSRPRTADQPAQPQPGLRRAPRRRRRRAGGGRFQADNTVTVRVREIARLGETIDALTKAGANRLYGIGFEVSEPRPCARRGPPRGGGRRPRPGRALRRGGGGDARAGDLDQRGRGGGPLPMYARAEAAAAVPIAEGTVTLTAEVEVVYGIE